MASASTKTPFGADIREWYVNVDKFPQNPDVVAAEFPTLPFKNNYADEVLLSHVLEHFGYADGFTLCMEMVRVLKPGGIAMAEVPDVVWCMAQFLGAPEPNGYTDPTLDYNTAHKWGLFAQAVWGDQHNDELYHKWDIPPTGCCTRSTPRVSGAWKSSLCSRTAFSP